MLRNVYVRRFLNNFPKVLRRDKKTAHRDKWRVAGNHLFERECAPLAGRNYLVVRCASKPTVTRVLRKRGMVASKLVLPEAELFCGGDFVECGGV
jgi:hypothetical protein